jgi:hypothetical protein
MLVEIGFTVVAQSGSSTLVVEKLEASGGENLIDLPASAKDGSFDAANDAVSHPVVTFGR